MGGLLAASAICSAPAAAGRTGSVPACACLWWAPRKPGNSPCTRDVVRGLAMRLPLQDGACSGMSASGANHGTWGEPSCAGRGMLFG